MKKPPELEVVQTNKQEEKIEVKPKKELTPYDFSSFLYLYTRFSEYFRYSPYTKNWYYRNEDCIFCCDYDAIEARTFLMKFCDELKKPVTEDENIFLQTGINHFREYRVLYLNALETPQRVNNVLAFLQVRCKCDFLAENLRHYIKFKNGLFHMPTKKFITNEDYVNSKLYEEIVFQRCMGINYIETSVKSPDKFLEFMEFLCSEDLELMEYLFALIGYFMTGYNNLQKFHFLYGTGKNGKSVFINLLPRLFGTYYDKIPYDMLLENAPPDRLYQFFDTIRGSRLLISDEIVSNKALKISAIKTITGGDYITARALYGVAYKYIAEFKILLFGNHEPIINTNDFGTLRRIVKIPTKNTVEDGKEKDMYDLIDEIMVDADEIGRICLDCYFIEIEKPNNKFGLPSSIMESTQEMISATDFMSEFINDCLIITDETIGFRELRKDVYAVYEKWCDDASKNPISKKLFAASLKEKGIKSPEKSSHLYWENVKINQSWKNKEQTECL